MVKRKLNEDWRDIFKFLHGSDIFSKLKKLTKHIILTQYILSLVWCTCENGNFARDNLEYAGRDIQRSVYVIPWDIFGILPIFSLIRISKARNFFSKIRTITVQ